MTNPDPTHITDAMWWLWTRCAETIPGVRLGGIYALKEGYHNTVNANKKSWPWSYSIKLPLDLTQPDDKARAIDLSMDGVQMALRTGCLKAAAEHPDDNRLYGLREFIGTLDGTSAFCMIKDTVDGPWDYDFGRDLTHTWHIHESVFTAYCDDMDAMRANASVLAGQTWEEWLGGSDMMTAQEKARLYNAEQIAWALSRGERQTTIVATWEDPAHGGHVGVPGVDDYPLSLEAHYANGGGGLVPHTHDVVATTGPARSWRRSSLRSSPR
jgi:hypothetical protein